MRGQHNNKERRQLAEKMEYALLAGSREAASSAAANNAKDPERTLRGLISQISTCASCGNILILKWTCQDSWNSMTFTRTRCLTCSACGSAVSSKDVQSRIISSASHVARLLKTTPQKVYAILPRHHCPEFRVQKEPLTAEKIFTSMTSRRPRQPKEKSQLKRNMVVKKQSRTDPYADDEERKVATRSGKVILWK